MYTHSVQEPCGSCRREVDQNEYPPTQQPGVQSHPMERDYSPLPPVEGSGYRRVEMFVYGPRGGLPRTMPICEETCSAAFPRGAAGMSMSFRQVEQECSNRGIESPIARFIGEDDDGIGNLLHMSCGLRRQPQKGHKKLVNGLKRLGLIDAPKPLEPRKKCKRTRKQSAGPANRETTLPKHHQRDSKSLDEIKYLPSCG